MESNYLLFAGNAANNELIVPSQPAATDTRHGPSKPEVFHVPIARTNDCSQFKTLSPALFLPR